MKSSDPMAEDTDLPIDLTVGQAMDRVLRAERDAQAAVAECERTCAEILEQARHQGRAILERAQARVIALHTRAAKRLELRAAELTQRRMKSAAAAAGQLADPGRRAAALERLAARLTTTDAARPLDGN